LVLLITKVHKEKLISGTKNEQLFYNIKYSLKYKVIIKVKEPIIFIGS